MGGQDTTGFSISYVIPLMIGSCDHTDMHVSVRLARDIST